MATFPTEQAVEDLKLVKEDLRSLKGNQLDAHLERLLDSTLLLCDVLLTYFKAKSSIP